MKTRVLALCALASFAALAVLGTTISRANPAATTTLYLPFMPRFLSPFLDTTFGHSGVVVTDLGGEAYALGMAQQPDGKTLIAASSVLTSTTDYMTTLRYNADGALDTTFGSGGIAPPVVASGQPIVTSGQPIFGSTQAVAVQPDGKIVQAAQIGWLVRLTPSGLPDPAFRGGGAFSDSRCGPITAGFDFEVSVVIQTDGKIAVSGHCRWGVVSRYLADGTPDPTFGSSGLVTMTVGSIEALALQPDGKLLGAGTGGNAPLGPGLTAATIRRLNPDGSLDPTFGQNGVATFLPADSRGGRLLAIALQPDGNILAAGVDYPNSPTTLPYFPNQLIVVRVHPDGSPDPTFGTNGIAFGPSDWSGPWPYSPSPRMAVQPDGKVVLAGAYTPGGNCRGWRLVRLTTNGALDPTFGFDGVIVTDPGGCGDAAGIVVQSNGQIVYAGDYLQPLISYYRLILARYVLQ